MIRALSFAAPRFERGRQIRRASFAPRSSLPLSAARLVANGVRETLARLLACEVETEFVEPVVPNDRDRRSLLHEARVVRVRGHVGDAFVTLRAADARRLVARAFGERDLASAPLSEIERTTLGRILEALAPLCAALVGSIATVAADSADRAAGELTTYFEVRTSEADAIAIGFALAHDPEESVAGRIALEDLAEVELRGRVVLARGPLELDDFADVAAGATLGLQTGLDDAGELWFGDTLVSRGRCGLLHGRPCFAVAAPTEAA